ncbi:MAG: DUF262 domain-containing HNH endonuclease family protein [Aestuariivita sp.]|nr:DUF262 domain-containing HNH endonuclease family protein [Aestuariivita sp.]
MPNNPPLDIKAAQKKIMDVFSNDYAFTIPPYQRPYAWETEHIEELLADLEDAMEANNPSDDFYFLGSIVLVKTPDNPDAKVIDGQQRLTTLTILFSVIRDLTEDPIKQSERAEFIKQKANEDKGLPETLRLELRDKDQPFFEQHIQKCGATNNCVPINLSEDSKIRILQNAQTIRTKLKKMHETERSALLQFILQKCYLVIVEVSTPIAARRIFTVLNARGLDLSATDILKADLLKQAGANSEDKLSQDWEDIETNLGRDKFNDLFTHIRMIYKREKPRRALETSFPEDVSTFKSEPSEFINKTLNPYADAFLLSLDQVKIQSEFGLKIADLMQSLNRLDNKDWLPPLLLCLKQYNDGNTSYNVSDFIFKLERLAYYLFVIRANINTRISRYAKVLTILDLCKEDDHKDSGLDITREEACRLFRELGGDIYRTTSVVKPILLRLDQASTDASAHYNYQTISVEHVCPQTIKKQSQWQDWFPTEEDHKQWVHSLGNLVLLDRRKNSAAQNYEFDLKKKKYFVPGNSSPFTLTKEIDAYKTWKPVDIENRRYELLKRLAKTWDLEDGFETWADAENNARRL